VGSSSYPEDKTLVDELEKMGVKIFLGYMENVEEIYQLSDIYIFPVEEMNSSIGLPLSILEARACGIPVVTTDFGSIRSYLEDDFGSIKYSKPSKFKKAVKGFRKEIDKNHESSRVSMLNKQFYEILDNIIEQ
jgi:glycosyltransferase involved in cell wall biosynthesis